jgi:hypothetical protein
MPQSDSGGGTCADWCASGVLLGYFAVGNDRGKVLLYRLRHYDAF